MLHGRARARLGGGGGGGGGFVGRDKLYVLKIVESYSHDTTYVM